MLLNNIAPKCGLYNDSWLRMTHLRDHVTHFNQYTCQINNVCPQNHITTDHIKYTFQIDSNTIAFDTSHDNQQIFKKKSINYVSLNLWTPIFSHGQLYITFF
jgi:hypothetical protein